MYLGSYQKRFALYGSLFGLCFPVIATLLQCFVEGLPFDFESIVSVQANSELLWIINTAPFFLGLFASFGGLQLDRVSARGKLLSERYDEMKALRQKADDANAAKSQFLANMSHEIRTPMNAIIGMSYLALKNCNEPEVANYIKKVESSGNSLLALVNDILDFSKADADEMVLERVPFKLESLFVELADTANVKLKSKPNIEFILNLASDLPDVIVSDQVRLRQVLTNILDNAIKFSESGDVTLSCSTKGKRGKEVELAFSIKDSGIGIQPQQLGKIFEPFKQADSSTTREYGGTGLGLVICKRIVELMDGDLRVASEPGIGTTFEFEIACTTQSLDTIASTHKLKTLDRLNVLLVDDSETAGNVLNAMLQSFGFSVHYARSAKDGLQLFDEVEASGQKIDLVVSDWFMPDMDGLELIDRIQSRSSQNQAVLLVSAAGEDAIHSAAKNDLIDGFLVKPVSPSALFDKIQEILTSREYAGVVAVPDESELSGYAKILSGMRILLVEDNEVNLELALALLEDVGIKCEVANNGQEGIEKATANSHDLVLMDIQMPVKDGLSATKELRDKHSYRTPIIAMTAHAMDGEREKSLEAGMNEHLTKPIDPLKLYETLAAFYKRDEADTAVLNGPNTPDARANETVLPAVDGLDTADGLARAAGKVDLFLKLLNKFSTTNRETPKLLVKLQRERDWDGLSRQLHSLGGVASNIGLNKWGAKALSLSKTVRDKDGMTGQERKELARLVSNLRKILKSLSVFFVQQTHNEKSKAPVVELSEARWAELLSEIKVKIADSSPEALTQIEAIRNDHQLSGAQSQLIDSLITLVDDFEFESALSKIQEYS